MAECYHCGLPVPENCNLQVEIGGESQPMCCPGCQAVAGAIVDGGLERFYRYRSSRSSRPEEGPEENSEAWKVYDLPEVQQDFVRPLDEGMSEVVLAVGGITCTACAWLIEHHLNRLPGLVSARVNVSTHRCRVVWLPDRLPLSEILAALSRIGYEARPAGDESAQQLRQREGRMFLLRLGVAGIGMMQAGMLAIALYMGAFSGMEARWELLLRWVSLIIATPVVLFSAQPFFQAAWHSLRHGHLVMDVPVSLAIGLAYGASVWATATERGEVYFDSVSMFTFFLLLGRFLEFRIRRRNEERFGSLSQLLPPAAEKVTDIGTETVPVKSLRPGDLILVAGGETIPCDGEVETGSGSVVEAVLTGEYLPVAKSPGSAVSAGTVNAENPLRIRVTAVAGNTRLAAIVGLEEEARAERPRQVAVADRLAGWFVGFVLLVAVASAAWWWLHAPERMLWISLSVLVVTCPCALSLATPAALAVATGELRRLGFLIRGGHVMETLARVSGVVFDKTGTLTLGNMRVGAVYPLGDREESAILGLAASLEQGSRHPIARAFRKYAATEVLHGVRHITGCGVTGEVAGQRFALGRSDFVADLLGIEPPPPPPSDTGLTLLLAGESGALAWILVTDQLRPGAADAIAGLARLGVPVALLSGDRPPAVEEMARRLKIREWRGGAGPEQKLAYLRQRQQNGETLLMVGDGINDVPVLGGADVSLAMGDATDFTRLHADSLLLSGNLATLETAIALSRRAKRIIHQNLGWALLYNLAALPLAVTGLVPPWAAAIGMSASSLLVVLNALRVRIPKPKRAGVPMTSFQVQH